MEETPPSAAFGLPTCLPTDDPARSPLHRLADHPSTTGSGGERLASSLGFLRFGPAPLHNYTVTHFHEILVGVPNEPATTGGTGRVRLLSMSKSTGDFIDPFGFPTQELEGPNASAQEFGHAVVGADVRSQYFSVGKFLALGQEVLVGAPGSEANTGAVHVYETRIDAADVTMSGIDRSDYSIVLIQTLTDPTGGNDRFGHAVATWATEPDELVPWVAVGAPDGQEVHLFTQSTLFAPTNLVHDSTITPADVGLGPTPSFGETLYVEDLDLDGDPELVIGAPAAGIVVMLDGTPTGPNLAGPVVINAGGALGSSDELGAALGAGQFFDPTTDAMTLVMGAPGGDGGSGGVCLQRFSPALFADTLTCFPSPLLASGTQRFGSSVAVGNFNPFDPWLSATSDLAMLDELAVGAPGSSDVTWTDNGDQTWTPAAASTAPSGMVALFSTDASGPVLNTTTPGTWRTAERPLTELVLQPIFTAGGTGFGTSLLAADVQETGRIDLISGAPGYDGDRGAVQVLNSTKTPDLEGSVGGDFVGNDSTAVPKTLRVVPDDGVSHVSTGGANLVANIVKDDGTGSGGTIPCTWSGDALGAAFPLLHTLGFEPGGSTTSTLTLYVRVQPAEDDDPFAPGTISATEPSNHRLRWVKIEADVTDANFGDSSPANDTLTVDLRAYVFGTGWTNFNVLYPACFIDGAPFTFTRVSGLAASCD